MKVIIASVIRTGSTLCYNMISDVFGRKNVSKKHSLNDGDLRQADYIFISYREACDSVISNMQAHNRPFTDKCIIKESTAIKKQGVNIGTFLKRHRTNKKVILLKYEDFVDNKGLILDVIKERVKDVKIKNRQEIIDKYDIKKIHKYIQKYKIFRQYDKVTHWHGKHISDDFGSVGKYKKILSESQILLIEKEMEQTNKFFGYQK